MKQNPKRLAAKARELREDLEALPIKSRAGLRIASQWRAVMEALRKIEGGKV